MTVSELIEFLKIMPQDYAVYFEHQYETAVEIDRVECDDTKKMGIIYMSTAESTRGLRV